MGGGGEKGGLGGKRGGSGPGEPSACGPGLPGGGYPFEAKKGVRNMVWVWGEDFGGCLFSQPKHLRPEASADLATCAGNLRCEESYPQPEFKLAITLTPKHRLNSFNLLQPAPPETLNPKPNKKP